MQPVENIVNLDSNVELVLGKALLKKELFEKVEGLIDLKVLSEDFRYIYKGYQEAHQLTDGDISPEMVLSQLSLLSTTTTARAKLYTVFMNRVNGLNEVSLTGAQELLQRVQERSVARKLADMATLTMLGRGGSIEDIKQYLTTTPTLVTEQPKLDLSIEAAKEYLNTSGEFLFTNGLEFLSTELGDLKLGRGNLLIVFALSNTGKSSFVAQYAVGLLKQGHKVLYFGNEDALQKILVNFYRTYYGLSDSEVLEGSIQTPAEFDKLTLIEAHGYTTTKCEKIIAQAQPDVIIFDQIDNVSMSNSTDDTQYNLEKLYQWTRSMAALHKCLAVNVTQASNDANGKEAGRMILTQHMMANSKIGKASTADVILGIGLRQQDDYARCITSCKNKINSNHSSVYCKLNPYTCRFEP